MRVYACGHTRCEDAKSLRGSLAPMISQNRIVMNYFSGQQGNEHLVPSDSQVILSALPSANKILQL